MKLNMYRQLFLKIIFLFFPCTLVGHELWIDTSEFKVEKGTKVDFDLRNGENFDGFSLGYFDRSVEKLYWRQNGERFDNASRQGDIPALQIEPDKNGLISAIYVSKPSVIKYKDFKKFQSFAIEKNAKDAIDLHLIQSFAQMNSNFEIQNIIYRILVFLVEVLSNFLLYLLLKHHQIDCLLSVSYTHLTLPTSG